MYAIKKTVKWKKTRERRVEKNYKEIFDDFYNLQNGLYLILIFNANYIKENIYS